MMWKLIPKSEGFRHGTVDTILNHQNVDCILRKPSCTIHPARQTEFDMNMNDNELNRMLTYESGRRLAD